MGGEFLALQAVYIRQTPRDENSPHPFDNEKCGGFFLTEGSDFVIMDLNLVGRG